MSTPLSLCPPSVTQMELMNKTLKPYGTPYLLPTVTDCVHRFFCNEKKCPQHYKSYFQEIKYPYEQNLIDKDIKEDEKKEIIASAKSICDYYGVFRKAQSEQINDDYGVLSGMVKYMWDDYRTLFSREYERIIWTTAFRHLQYKTQVMVNSASDDQRTRLLHSTEVEKIAKKIAIGVHANWELAATIAIAHDIGHTPFGHEGETTIKEFLRRKNSGLFSHALQSVKVLDELSMHPILERYNISGLGLSDYVLEGVMKHDSDTFTDGMLNPEFRQQYEVERLCDIVGEGVDNDAPCKKNRIRKGLKEYLKNADFPESDIKLPHVLIGSVEAQIVTWADKIAYLGHDWEEFIDTGLLEKMMSRINDMVLEIEKIHNLYKDNPAKDNEAEQIIKIWKGLTTINNLYTRFDAENQDYCSMIWKDVRCQIEIIVEAIKNIENNCIKVKTGTSEADGETYSCHKYFSAREYAALKNYLIVTASWAELLRLYPRTYGMKNDPIYVFYMYLTKVRSIVITPRVTQAIIEGTNKYVEKLDPTSKMNRKEYLVHCNEKWVHKYCRVNQKMWDSKKARRCLKDSVRTCFLVGFHDEATDDVEYLVGYGTKDKPQSADKCDFDQKYNCLLYVFDFIRTEFIQSTRVKFMKYTANEIVNTLLEYYYEYPDMLPFTYRSRYNQSQYKLANQDNIPEVTDEKYKNDANVCKARAVADYVANMTDRMAKLKFDEIKSSDSKWSNSYSTGLI